MSYSVPVISREYGFYAYLREVNKIPCLKQEEELSLAKSYLERNDIAAAQKLVASHLKLVVKLALKYKNYGLPIQELISEGNLGLMQAVKKYNPHLGFRLSTYAMWWIKAAIQEFILRSWSLVKIGTTAAQKKLFFSLGKIKNKLTALYSRNVNDSDFPEIANRLGVEEKEVREMNARLVPDMSLNSLVRSDDGDGIELIEFLPETRADQELTVITRQEGATKKRLLLQAMSSLNTRENEIFKARRLREDPLTLDELSGIHHISKERVRQIESKAFEKIQNFMLAAMPTPV